MRRASPLLLALLAACSTTPTDGADSSIAHAAGPRSSEMAARLQNQNPNLTTTPEAAAASTNTSPGSLTAPAIDANQRREYADVYVDLKDPSGQKPLVYYLMKPEEWHIEKVSQLTPTTKHWRFWRVARTDGKAMPEVDPLRPRRP
ncbi:MAG TPA: hypothetical protein VF950_02840 [Planctomycetota bacterium]